LTNPRNICSSDTRKAAIIFLASCCDIARDIFLSPFPSDFHVTLNTTSFNRLFQFLEKRNEKNRESHTWIFIP
jgi:hypothetical protein